MQIWEELRGDNQRAVARLAQGATDSLDLGAWGYTLHGACNLLEKYFLRISKFFEKLRVVAEATVYRAGLDVDMAIWGRDERKARRLVASSSFPVDLHVHDELPPTVQDRILNFGKEL